MRHFEGPRERTRLALQRVCWLTESKQSRLSRRHGYIAVGLFRTQPDGRNDSMCASLHLFVQACACGTSRGHTRGKQAQEEQPFSFHPFSALLRCLLSILTVRMVQQSLPFCVSVCDNLRPKRFQLLTCYLFPLGTRNPWSGRQLYEVSNQARRATGFA